MYKSYRVKAFKFREVSGGRGTITYFLVDELGEKRSVTAVAKTGLFKKIKSVKAIHHRETPLVEALANSSINDTIAIDFSSFNRRFPRVHANSQNEKLSRGTMKVVNSGHNISSLESLNIDTYRLLQLFSIASVALMVGMILMTFFE